jgi:hypothetical protein
MIAEYLVINYYQGPGGPERIDSLAEGQVPDGASSLFAPTPALSS